MRWLLLAHRYLGIVLGAVMLMWCLSGMVMIFVPYPALSPATRVQHLPPMEWHGCCVTGAVPADDAVVRGFSVEMLGATPVLRLRARGGALVDLSNGNVLSRLSEQQAREVAAAWGRTAGSPGTPQLQRVLTDTDQWTLEGGARSGLPLYLFTLGDPAGTQLYVSAVTGQAVQVTTGAQRFWSYLGAVPHWLYFTGLRRNGKLWTQVVIGSSLAGTFLTVLGLYIGVRAWLRSRGSAYRGVLFLHHVPGLIFGVFLLTWAASGLVSMNPWGFLDSEGGMSAAIELAGSPPTGVQVKAAVRALPALPGVVSVSAASLSGRLYLIASRADGSRQRLDASGHPAPLTDQDWARMAQELAAGRPERLATGDVYFSAPHPVYRMISTDADRTRYYFDALTGSLLASYDSNGRWYRWLFQAVHTLDFTPGVLRYLLLFVLLTGAAVTAATGTYLGWRRLTRRRARVRPAVPASP